MTADARPRWVAAGLAILFAVLALASGLDRYSGHEPAAVRLVPAPFRSDAARMASYLAAVRGDTSGALAQARLAVRHDPLSSLNVGALAVTSGASGQRGAAHDAFAVGHLLGWRHVLTQQYLFEINLAEGSLGAAARSLDAILRARSDLVLVHDLLGRLEQAPGGREALVTRLRGDPAWAALYLTAFQSDDAVLRRRARFLAAADSGLSPLGCRAVAPMVEALAARRYRAEAVSLAARHCPRMAPRGLLADPGFSAFAGGQGGALGWQRQSAGDVRVSARDEGIEIANRASVTRLVLSQPVALSKGRYILAGTVQGLDPGLLVASLGCGTPQRPAAPDGLIAGEGQVLLAEGCADEVLGLWLRPGGGALQLGELRLTAR